MSARKRLVTYFVICGLAVSAGGIAWAYVRAAPHKTARLQQKTYRLTIQQPAANGGVHGYQLEAAEAAGDQARGLGGRTSLPEDQGMLFIYDGDVQRCFWMKGMHFAIDMIWLDSNKTVTHIDPDVQPGTYPQMFCYVGSYVVELNAGEAARNHLQPGQKITF